MYHHSADYDKHIARNERIQPTHEVFIPNGRTVARQLEIENTLLRMVHVGLAYFPKNKALLEKQEAHERNIETLGNL